MSTKQADGCVSQGGVQTVCGGKPAHRRLVQAVPVSQVWISGSSLSGTIPAQGQRGILCGLSHDALTCPRPGPLYKTAGRMHETQPSLSGGKRHLSLTTISICHSSGVCLEPAGGSQVAAVTPWL